MKINILGRLWGFCFVPNLGPNRGLCDPPDAKDKKIRIQAGLRGEELVEVVLHEFLHAAGWHIDEEFVTRFAANAAHGLNRLGLIHADDE